MEKNNECRYWEKKRKIKKEENDVQAKTTMKRELRRLGYEASKRCGQERIYPSI